MPVVLFSQFIIGRWTVENQNLVLIETLYDGSNGSNSQITDALLVLPIDKDYPLYQKIIFFDDGLMEADCTPSESVYGIYELHEAAKWAKYYTEADYWINVKIATLKGERFLELTGKEMNITVKLISSNEAVITYLVIERSGFKLFSHAVIKKEKSN